MPKEKYAAILSIDGGARGNPGPAACAVVVGTADGKRLDAFSKYLGETTNNVAEYEGLVAALDYAFRRGWKRVKVLSDSELMVRQVRGEYKVKSAGLKPLHQQAMEMIARLEVFAIAHIPRGQNREADRLVNKALDGGAHGAQQGDLLHDSVFESPQKLHVQATFRRGALRFRDPLPLREGEEVEVVIRRRK